MLQLRNYQSLAIESFKNSTLQRSLIVLSTGLGKTYTGLALAQSLGQKCLWLAHRSELITQPIKTLRAINPSANYGVVQADKNEYMRDFVFASIQSAQQPKRIEQLARQSFGLVVVDECFPAGTMVDGRPIESLIVGDEVLSVDHQYGEVVKRRIVRVFTKTAVTMVTLMVGGRTIVSTANHPFFVKGRGYVSADEIARDDLLCVWGNFHQHQNTSCADMLERVQRQDICGAYGGHKSALRFGKDENTQPDAPRQQPGEDESDTQENWAPPFGSRWQRNRSEHNGETSSRGDGNDYSFGCENGNETGVRIPLSLQTRPWVAGEKDSRGSRRQQPRSPVSPRARQKKGSALVWARVESIQSVDQGSPDGCIVYNIEVEGSHTYFANGILVHNCHHALSPGYRALIEQLGCYRDGGPRLLGLTATPERSDNGALDEVFQGVVFQMGLSTAIEQGYLVSPAVKERAIKVDLDSIMVARGDFSQKVLDLELMKAGIVEEIVAAYHEHCANRKTIIFVISVAQAEQVAEALRQHGYMVAALSGETPNDQRAKILQRLHTGELSCVVNCMVLTEGFDEPSVDAIILARPTQSKPLMIQMVGRGLRLFPGKDDCLVIDMVGASRRHTMVQAAVLFGLKKDPLEEETKPLAADPITDPEEYWRKRLSSQIKGVRAAPRSKLHWLPTSDSVGWLLPTGKFGTICMLPVGDDWRVEVLGAAGQPMRQQLSDQPVSLEMAQAISEDYYRRVDAVLASGGAWREQPATDAQVKALSRFGVKANGLTKGTATDLLEQHKTQKTIEPASPRQIAFLRRNGHHVPDGISKREAAQMFARMNR